MPRTKGTSKTGGTKPNVPATPAAPHEAGKYRNSRIVMNPAASSAVVIDFYYGNLLGKDCDSGGLFDELLAAQKRCRAGDLGGLEDILVGQAMTLQVMFASLARRAQAQEYQKHLEAFMGLALKCQAQSRATIDSLVNLKYPRTTVIAKQANINSNGQQQVNNGVAQVPDTRVEKSVNAQNELLEEARHGGTYLDGAAAPAAAGGDQTLVPVGAINRPQDR
jgi:hypothetical protein